MKLFLNLNSDINIAKEFHEITKHSPISIYTNLHFLDWENKPFPFKFYKNLKPLLLPRDFNHPNVNALSCLENKKKLNVQSSILDLALISQILFYSAGVTRRNKFDNYTYYMRAASATGALYPIEIYLSCSQVPDLNDGLYHFCAGDFTLTKLFQGDFKYLLYNILFMLNIIFYFWILRYI